MAKSHRPARLERKALLRAKRKARGMRKLRIQRLLWSGYIKSPEDVPDDAIPAVVSEQKPGPELFPFTRKWYRDKPFACKDCGVEQTWTALEQLHYYEVLKGPAPNEPSRCGPCRRKHNAYRRLHTRRMHEAAERRKNRDRGRLGPLRKGQNP